MNAVVSATVAVRPAGPSAARPVPASTRPSTATPTATTPGRWPAETRRP